MYWLKQAFRDWFINLSGCLADWGFKCSNSDTSTMDYNYGGVFLVLLIYVDDILITWNDFIFITSLITCLNKVFLLKN